MRHDAFSAANRTRLVGRRATFAHAMRSLAARAGGPPCQTRWYGSACNVSVPMVVVKTRLAQSNKSRSSPLRQSIALSVVPAMIWNVSLYLRLRSSGCSSALAASTGLRPGCNLKNLGFMEPFFLHHKLHESKELSKVPQESEENTSRLLHIFRRETSSREVLEKVYGKLDEMQTALVSPRPENERVWDYTPQRPRKAQSSLLPRRLGVLLPPTQTIYAPPMASDADLYCSHLRYLNEIYAWLPVFLCRPPLGSTSSRTYV